ncbi:hypothetical protein Droror1_Dr00025484 [Drosera rotundifolia]
MGSRFPFPISHFEPNPHLPVSYYKLGFLFHHLGSLSFVAFDQNLDFYGSLCEFVGGSFSWEECRIFCNFTFLRSGWRLMFQLCSSCPRPVLLGIPATEIPQSCCTMLPCFLLN